MKCEDYWVLIQEYLDGELEEQAARRLKAHVDFCSTCAGVYQEKTREQELYSRYHQDRDIEISTHLWNAVQARITKRLPIPASGWVVTLREWGRERWAIAHVSPALTLVLVLLAIGITVAVMKLTSSREGREKQYTAGQNQKRSENPRTENGKAGRGESAGLASKPSQEKDNRTALTGPSGSSRPRTTPTGRRSGRVEASAVAEASHHGPNVEKLVREAEQKYLAAIALLQRDAQRHTTSLDPAVRAQFDGTLAAIDRAIAETREAARRRPDDPVAVQYMLTAYAKKVEVLQEMGGL